MALFSYNGRDQYGKKVTGTFRANKIQDVLIYLKNRKITPITIDKIKTENRLINLLKSTPSFSKVKQDEIMNFCRQMATLSQAGVTTLDALKQLAQVTEDRILSKALGEIAESIASGKSLAISMREHPKIFSSIFTNIIDVGENTGHLIEAFTQLTSYLEVSVANKRRLLTTIRYPLTVIAAATIAVILMNFLVIPKFKQIFAHFQAQLPLPTKILIASSDIMLNYWWVFVLVVVLAFIAIPRIFSSTTAKYYWDKYKLKLPIFGTLQKRIILAQFTWTLSLILRSGVPISKGIALAANASGNTYFAKQILNMRDALEEGNSFYQAATKSTLFPPTVLQMIAVGEETGRLENLLTQVSSYYEREIDYDIKRLNDLAEPLLLAIVGAVVMLLAVGIYLPMWDLVKVVKF